MKAVIVDWCKRVKKDFTVKHVLVVWIIVFSTVVIYGQYQNHQRISDIQKSRVFSCRANYITTRNWVIPFFPPKNHRTPKQKRDLVKFLHLTNPNKCITQVKTK